MQNDWIDSVDWVMLVAGAVVGIALQALIAVIFRYGGVATNGMIMLVVTLLAVSVAGYLAARRRDGREAKVVNGVGAGLLCAAIALIASVSSSAGGNQLLGIIFLFVSYTIMGLLGALLPGAVQQVRERVAQVR